MTAVSIQYAEDSSAQVIMRESFHIDTAKGLKRTLPAERISLPFGQISSILQERPVALYFPEEDDRMLFLAIYPQYEGYEI